VLIPARSQAQWWGARAPADFEECAEAAEKAASKEAKATQLSECGVKFAARRKVGGGYSYFDFMQNRHFDLAGPNPTPQEQRHIDEQYAAYLARARQSAIAAAFLQKQQQMQRAGPEAEKKPAIPLPASKPRAATVGSAASRPRNTSCPGDSFSCNWPRLADGIKDFKKLFGSSPEKTKRSRASADLATSNR
jgi:rhodanese-related sulfurtransferase